MSHEETHHDPKLHNKALTEYLERLTQQMEDLYSENKRIHDRLNFLERSTSPRSKSSRNTSKPKFKRRPPDPNNEGDDSSDYDEAPRYKRHSHKTDNTLGSVKLDIPYFRGKSDPESFLEWEREVELIFQVHDYTDERKVMLASLKLKDYAALWWDEFQTTRR